MASHEVDKNQSTTILRILAILRGCSWEQAGGVDGLRGFGGPLPSGGARRFLTLKTPKNGIEMPKITLIFSSSCIKVNRHVLR